MGGGEGEGRRRKNQKETDRHTERNKDGQIEG